MTTLLVMLERAEKLVARLRLRLQAREKEIDRAYVRGFRDGYWDRQDEETRLKESPQPNRVRPDEWQSNPTEQVTKTVQHVRDTAGY